MTIAAGLLHRDGVLLCADTEQTGWAMKLHAAKLGHFAHPAGKVAWAYAGNVNFAVSAIQKCRRRLEAAAPTDTLGELEAVLDEEYRRNVLSHPGYATDGTPVDCVRLARLGLVEGFEADLVVAGINHGSNLGDDITYSGTVAAALEAIVLGLPGIAVSQQSSALELDFRIGSGFDFDVAADFTARLVAELESVPLPSGTLLNVNVPGERPAGVEVARLGKRVYRDKLALIDEGDGGRRLYRIYGDAGYEAGETGTDLAALARGKIAVTPIHFDLTDREGLSALRRHDLDRLISPVVSEADREARWSGERDGAVSEMER